jgi:hypothetical protein
MTALSKAERDAMRSTVEVHGLTRDEMFILLDTCDELERACSGDGLKMLVEMRAERDLLAARVEKCKQILDEVGVLTVTEAQRLIVHALNATDDEVRKWKEAR